VKTSRQWILYTLLRIGIFAGAMILLVLVGTPPWLAAIIAAVIGTCVTYLFFRKQREAVARSLWEYRNSRHVDEDSEAENAALDDHEDRPTPER